MRSAATFAGALAGAALLLLFIACDKSDPTAPPDGAIDVSASPSSIDFDADPDGTSTITATVVDKEGRPVSGAGVRFSRTSGKLRSNGESIRTDEDGAATDILTLALDDDDSTVTARSGKLSGTVVVSNLGRPSRPTADFSASLTSGTADLSVTFTDLSTHNPTAWDWDFGDSTTHATTQSPSHTYQTAGTFSVTLKATNLLGSGTTTKANFITVLPLLADFTGTPTSVSVSQSVQFTDTSTGTHPPTSWDWDFGDATPHGITQSPSHQYSTTGTFTVTLKATNSLGSNTKTRTNYITVN